MKKPPSLAICFPQDPGRPIFQGVSAGRTLVVLCLFAGDKTSAAPLVGKKRKPQVVYSQLCFPRKVDFHTLAPSAQKSLKKPSKTYKTPRGIPQLEHLGRLPKHPSLCTAAPPQHFPPYMEQLLPLTHQQQRSSRSQNCGTAGPQQRDVVRSDPLPHLITST